MFVAAMEVEKYTFALMLHFVALLFSRQNLSKNVKILFLPHIQTMNNLNSKCTKMLINAPITLVKETSIIEIFKNLYDQIFKNIKNVVLKLTVLEHGLEENICDVTQGRGIGGRIGLLVDCIERVGC